MCPNGFRSSECITQVASEAHPYSMSCISNECTLLSSAADEWRWQVDAVFVERHLIKHPTCCRGIRSRPLVTSKQSLDFCQCATLGLRNDDGTVDAAHKGDGSEHKEAAIAEPGVQRQEDKVGDRSCRRNKPRSSVHAVLVLGIHVTGRVQEQRLEALGSSSRVQM